MKTVYALWIRNLKLFARDRMRLIFSTIFPFFFVFIFNSIFKNEFIENPITYMLAGVIVSTIFDFSLRISSSTIDDMTSGFMKEVLVSPISRISVAAGQFFSSATISTIQGLIIFVVGFFIGLRISSPFTVILVIFTMIFIGLIFSGFGLFIATNTKNTQTFQVVTMAITVPMTFISGAYFPFTVMPDALKYVGWCNPMTYAVMLFRAVALEKTGLSHEALVQEDLAIKMGNFVVTPFISFLILVIFGFLFLALSTMVFSKMDFSKINRNKADMMTDY